METYLKYFYSSVGEWFKSKIKAASAHEICMSVL